MSAPSASGSSSAPSSPRIALITGAGSGIGLASAHALLAAGWHVVFSGRRLETLEAAIAAAPLGDAERAGRCRPVVADVRDAASVAALFEAVDAWHGRLDLLFNNAGTFPPSGPLEDLPLEHWQGAVDTNLTGMFLCTQQAFRRMKRQQPSGGRIINNGSISAYAPRLNAIAYTSTKHAVTGLTKAAALEGRAHGIAVGQLDIGNAASDMTAAMARGQLQADGNIRPEARMEVRHAAEAVVHMASLPLEANVLFMTVMATGMPYLGRG